LVFGPAGGIVLGSNRRVRIFSGGCARNGPPVHRPSSWTKPITAPPPHRLSIPEAAESAVAKIEPVGRRSQKIRYAPFPVSSGFPFQGQRRLLSVKGRFSPTVLREPIACDHGRPRRPVNGVARSFRRT
jgi:hypothetical protein